MIANRGETARCGIHTAEVTRSIPAAPRVISGGHAGRCSSKLASGFSQGVGSTGDHRGPYSFKCHLQGFPPRGTVASDGSLGRTVLVARGGAVQSRPAHPSDADAMASALAAGTFDSDQPVQSRFRGRALSKAWASVTGNGPRVGNPLDFRVRPVPGSHGVVADRGRPG